MPGTETQFKVFQKSMIPLKVQYPLPTYRIGAVSAGGRLGQKKS